MSAARILAVSSGVVPLDARSRCGCMLRNRYSDAAYALGAVLAVDLMQRFSQRPMFVASQIGFAAGALMSAFAHGPWLYGTGRVVYVVHGASPRPGSSPTGPPPLEQTGCLRRWRSSTSDCSGRRPEAPSWRRGSRPPAPGGASCSDLPSSVSVGRSSRGGPCCRAQVSTRNRR